MTPIGIRGSNSGGTHGDPYRGILVTDGRLVAKDSGGSNWYWESTEIYEYENGKMKETWELGITLPEFFLIGQGRIGSGIKILAYSGCQQQENGSYEHEISQWGISEDEWMLEQSVYFREQ